MSEIPILYSFRRCPYAMRARLAIKACKLQVEIREVVLANKPKELLTCSSKGTVPVLLLPNGEVIDESKDIMSWALSQTDPHHWLSTNTLIQKETNYLIDLNDGEFKSHLDHYKYSDRFPEQPVAIYRLGGEKFLQELETKLEKDKYLMGDKLTLADVAIFPFIRQFAHVDKAWFYNTEYKKLQAWLDRWLATALFVEVMRKYPQWNSGLVNK